jgi:hypothetical protein
MEKAEDLRRKSSRRRVRCSRPAAARSRNNVTPPRPERCKLTAYGFYHFISPHDLIQKTCNFWDHAGLIAEGLLAMTAVQQTGFFHDAQDHQ